MAGMVKALKRKSFRKREEEMVRTDVFSDTCLQLCFSTHILFVGLYVVLVKCALLGGHLQSSHSLLPNNGFPVLTKMLFPSLCPDGTRHPKT